MAGVPNLILAMRYSRCGHSRKYAHAGVCAKTNVIVGKLPVVRISSDLDGNFWVIPGSKGAGNSVRHFAPMRLNIH